MNQTEVRCYSSSGSGFTSLHLTSPHHYPLLASCPVLATGAVDARPGTDADPGLSATMSAALQTGADARAMRNTKWPEEFSKKVNISKVNLPVIKKWVSDEITRILNSDDDVVTEMIFTFLESGKFVSGLSRLRLRQCPSSVRDHAD